MKLQLENPGSSRDLGSLPEATMSDDSSESVVPTIRGVAPPPARLDDLKVLRTGLRPATVRRHQSTPTPAEYGDYLQRFRFAVKRLGTLEDASYILNVPKTQLRHPSGGSRDKNLSVFLIAALAKAAGVNFHWLATGQGPVVGAPVPATTPEQPCATVHEPPQWTREVGLAALALARMCFRDHAEKA